MTEDNARAAALAAPLPEEGIERTLGAATQKGYDTTGYGYQWCVNRFNEVCGQGWGYSWEVLREAAGVFERSGKPYWDITVTVAIWVESSERVRSMPGGHISGSYADALKGAITNGFKKAAAMWGVGRQAYEGTIDDDNAPAQEGPEDMRPPTVSRTAPREHWCAEHNTAFQRRTGKDGSIWYSHKQGDGWCNDKEDEPQTAGRRAQRAQTAPDSPKTIAESPSLGGQAAYGIGWAAAPQIAPRRAERTQKAADSSKTIENPPPSRVGALMGKREEFAQAYADAFGWDLLQRLTTVQQDDMGQTMRVWLAEIFKRNDPDTPHELSFDLLSPEEQDTAIGMLRAQARGEAQRKKKRETEQEGKSNARR